MLSYNLYSYCENNPIVHIDAEGNWLARVVCGVASATIFGALALVTCKILGLDSKTTTIVTVAFAALGGIIGAALGPSFLSKHCKTLLNAINKIEKTKFSIKCFGPNLDGNIFGITISKTLIIMLHAPHPKYGEWFFHLQVEVKIGKTQRPLWKYPLLYVNPLKWGKK